MLEGVMLLWFILTGLSVAFVVWDSLVNGVTSWVQRLAWILVTIYTGPIGAFLYLLGCRRPFPGGHDLYTAAAWKQGLNSEMHCLAGDATGIIVAASVVPALSLANGWDVLIEYIAGFVFGLFIFQALMMVGMYGGNYLLAIRKTVFAETVSMNMVMTGMIPVMVVLAAIWPHSMDPLEPAFWFRMSLASMAGGLFAFPINHWLVRNHLKHGCMTLPGADGPAPGLGHRSPESRPVDGLSTHGSAGQNGHSHAMAGRDMAAHGSEADAASGIAPMGEEHGPTVPTVTGSHGPDQDLDAMHTGHAGADLAMHEQGAHATHSANREIHADRMQGDRAGHSPDHSHQGMKMRELSSGVSLVWIIGTYALLLGAIWLTARWVPIGFTGSDDAPGATASAELPANDRFAAATPPGLVQNRH
jgi:hypothetical protein